MRITNNGEKPYKISAAQVELETSDAKHTDEAASGVDFDRYLQALPTLKPGVLEPLKADIRIEPKGTIQRTILVSFPVDAVNFTNRKLLRVTISADREPVPLVLTQEKQN